MGGSVDRGLAWRKSRACSDSACIEVARDGDVVLVRNSERPADITRHTRAEWTAFVDGVKTGEFEL